MLPAIVDYDIHVRGVLEHQDVLARRAGRRTGQLVGMCNYAVCTYLPHGRMHDASNALALSSWRATLWLIVAVLLALRSLAMVSHVALCTVHLGCDVELGMVI